MYTYFFKWHCDTDIQGYIWSELRFHNIQFYHVSFYKQVIFYLYHDTGQEIICCKSISVVVKKKNKDVVILLFLFPKANIAANN